LVRHRQQSRLIYGFSDDGSFHNSFSRDPRYKKSVLHADIFSSENHRGVCGIFPDISRSAIHKEAIVEKAQEVIRENLQTVRQIASLPEENAAKSEVNLNSIIQPVTTQEIE